LRAFSYHSYLSFSLPHNFNDRNCWHLLCGRSSFTFNDQTATPAEVSDD